MNRKELNNFELKHFINTCDPSMFRKNLREILEDNDIKQIDLAKAIGVDNQTISNWLNEDSNYRPKWVDYMYKLNEFLYRRVKNYNPLNLFTRNKFVSNILLESIESSRINNALLKKREQDKTVLLLSMGNGRLSNGLKWKGVDYKRLFYDPKFHKIIENINENYYKVPVGQRINKNSKEVLQRELFDFIVKFLESQNKPKT